MSSSPRKLYSADQLRELDRRFIEERAVPGFELMNRAAGSAFKAIRSRWPESKRWVVLVGPGNNGGDGLLIAAMALQAGVSVRLFYLADPDQAAGDAATALQAFREAGGRAETELAEFPLDTDLLVDALLGIGLTRSLEGRFLEAVQRINERAEQGCAVAAVDIPTGLDANSGRIWGDCVRAQITPSFIGAKLGLYTGEGPAYAGETLFDDLGAPDDLDNGLEPAAWVIHSQDRLPALAPRSRSAHKGSFGHVLSVGGNHGMSGAIRIAAEAALRAGAGLSSVATRGAHAAALTQACPEIMCRAIGNPGELRGMLQAADVVAVGPGLGQDAWAKALFEEVLDSRLPLVVDADALNLLAAEPRARGRWILTPHPGEAARMLGCDTADVQSDRPSAVRELCRRYDAVVILKGSGTLVAGPGTGLWLNRTGNPGMATGGMGDLLTGITAGLLAQTGDIALAARLAVWIHGRAGDLASEWGERGLLPTDLLQPLRQLVNP